MNNNLKQQHNHYKLHTGCEDKIWIVGPEDTNIALVPEGLKVHRIRYCLNSCQQLLCYTLYYRYKYNFIGQHTAPWLFPFRLNCTNISCLKKLILDRQRAVNIAFVWLVELTFVLLDFLLVIKITTCTYIEFILQL